MTANLNNDHWCQGFSLVEVALAMLVVGVGLFGVFALFPAGTEANRKAIQETQISQVAEFILNGFRYESEQVAWREVKNEDTFSIAPLASVYAWENPQEVEAGSGVKKLTFSALKNPDIEEMSFRYELTVGDLNSDNRKYILLDIWYGSYGPADVTNSYRFYTEVYNFGLGGT